MKLTPADPLRLVLICVSLLLLTSIASVFAAPSCTLTCYVTMTGSDANSGTTPALALRNIQTAVDQVSSGGTVIVEAGLYTENVVIPTGLNVTVDGAGAGTNSIIHTIVDGNDTGSVFTIASGTVMLSDMTLRDGASLPGDPGNGVYSTTANLTLQGMLITSNGGAGVYSNLGNDLTVIGSTIASNNGFAGAGIRQEVGGDLVVTNSTIIGNIASSIGGGIFLTRASSALIDSSTISGNSAGQGAGVFQTNTQPVYIVNTTISGNTASGNGGGLNNFNDGDTDCSNCTSETIVINSTIAGNTAASGANVYNASVSGGDPFPNNPVILTLSNTILAEPSSDNCVNFNSGGSTTFTSNGHNLSDDMSCAAFFTAFSDLNGAAALLGALADNGGATQTRALGAGSAALSAGDGVICAAVPVNNTDQRGIARPQGGGCDIGAYESALSPVTPTTPAPTTPTPTTPAPTTPAPTTPAPTTPAPTTPAPTTPPPSGTPFPEPDVMCPAGMTQVGGTYMHTIFLPETPRINANIVIPDDGNVTLVVASMVGHPEVGCPFSGDPICSQTQNNEEFNILINETQVASVPDHGDDRWEVFTFDVGALAQGMYDISFVHTGNPVSPPSPGSTTFKGVACAVFDEEAALEVEALLLDVTIEPTPEPEPTPELTDEATAEPTAEVTAEVTDDPTPEVTDEVTDEPTTEITEDVTDEATAEVTLDVKPTEEATPTEEPTP